MEALGEDLSREDGMRYCYQTATFYLFMPGRRGRSARVLKDSRYVQQMASPEYGGTEPTPRFTAPLATARLSDRVQGTSGRRDLRLTSVNGPANPGYTPQNEKVPRSTDVCWVSAEPT